MKLTCEECGRVFDSEMAEAVDAGGPTLFSTYHRHLDTHLLQESIDDGIESLCDAIEGDEEDPDPDDGEGLSEEEKRKLEGAKKIAGGVERAPGKVVGGGRFSGK